MKILIVDDHAVIRQTLGMIINTEFPNSDCISVENGQTCLNLLINESFDLVILDLNLPDIDGIKLTSQIREAYPRQMIMIFTMNPTNLFAAELYRMGVMGYLNKQADIKEIKKALHTVLREQRTYVDQSVNPGNDKRYTKTTGTNPFNKLSHRELEVARMLAKGKSMEEIAAYLSIGASTIRTYKARVFEKLDVSTTYDFLTKAKMYELEPTQA